MALRVYKDADGADWRVWRVVPDSGFSSLDASYREGWLCFERADGSDRRRLSMSQAPAEWEALSDQRLDTLRSIAEPATRKSVASKSHGDTEHSDAKARE
ncbi:MAG TPA: hypothetical protein VM033_07405 [Gemmatimonadaceae bacterium]|nr:hypothetical protein [Gemmatimonadaceae bacterium]